MGIRKWSIGLAMATSLVMGIVFMGTVPKAEAETLSGEGFIQVTKIERFPIDDVEGRFFNVTEREGAAVFGNKDWAWVKNILTADASKGAGTGEMYQTLTFVDGSRITAHTKGTIGATPAGAPTVGKWTGDIINGTGRFQGIKGTQTASSQILSTEKGETVGKVLFQITIVYTLPGK